MTKAQSDLAYLAGFAMLIALLGGVFGYSTCQISHHRHGCDDGSTRCTQ
jgi:hypothetical protein